VEQSIGRSHRKGQVNPALHAPDRLDEQDDHNGAVCWHFGLLHLVSCKQDLPTEERQAILMKKMSHLKANTTGKPLIQLWANA